MSLSRISSRFPRIVLARCRNSMLKYTPQRHHRHHLLPVLSNQFHSLSDSQNKVIAGHVSLLHHSALNASVFQRFGFSSSASHETTEKESSQSGNGGDNAENNGVTEDAECELTMEDLVKLVAEKEELLTAKHKEIEKMQDKVLRTYAEMENVKDRTRREAENSKKFAIQNFAKSLLDVADNLGRASSVVKDSFSKIDTSKDDAGVVPLLKTLMEGVEMTEKQLAEVFKKFGVVKYDPTNDQFDPNRHNAVFQVPDASKPPGTVAVVLKPGYALHDRVIRPAEVGVTQVPADN
ncbi:GrpE protein 2, mitochondrial [Sarracenia purpurea var. burkii]